MHRNSLPELPRERSVPRISSSLGENEVPELGSPRSPGVEELRVRAERKERLRKDRHQAVPDKIAFRAEKYPIYLKLMEDEIKVCDKNIDRFNLHSKNTISNAKLKNIPEEQVRLFNSKCCLCVDQGHPRQEPKADRGVRAAALPARWNARQNP